MDPIWRRVFVNMAVGQTPREVIVKSAALAIPAAMLAVPYFYFLIFDFPRRLVPVATKDAYILLWAQSGMMLLICMLSAMVGFVFAKRRHLPGIGKTDQWMKDMPYLTAGGLALMLIIHFAFDRYFYIVSPESFPDISLYMLLLPLKGAITEELILRFGLVTIAAGICRNKYGGAALVAVFATILSIKYLGFVGIRLDWSYVCIMQLVLSFTMNMILGVVFVTRGLLSAMTVKFMLELRYGVAAIFLG